MLHSRSLKPHRLSRGPAPRRACLALELLEDRALPSATINVDAAANVHAIDPNIYGTAFASTTQLADLNIALNRDGGNASDTYSFAQDATNHGNDWFFESIASGSGNGQGMDSFVSTTQGGGARPSITLNLLDWAAKLGSGRSNLGSFSVAKYGPQQSTDPYNSNWGNGVHTNGTNITGNDPNDAYIANTPAIEQAWIQHLISTFGDSQHGGVPYYNLGNEPGLWNSTHRDIHPAGDTLPELRDRIIAYASMVKSLDPGAKILGPEEWGWTNYFISGADAAASNWGATYNGLNAEAWLLDQLRQHDAGTGQRLLDYFTLHFYPQGGQFSNDVSTNMELLRNRSTRSLWDPNYVDESWIASTGINGGKVNLINLMKSWVNTYYPGTKIGITEYNWGAEGDMNGATTQADIWGIFGREGLDLADRWTTPAAGSPTYLAMKMFRNYDGNKSAFGDQSVAASVGNPDQVDAFSAVRSSDGTLTVLVVNKNLFDPNNPAATTQVTINLSNFASAGVAQEWQLAAINPSDQTKASITHLSDIHFSGTSFTVAVPQESVEMFILKPASQAGALAFSTTGYTVNENAGTATITVTRSGGSAGAVTVNYAASDGTARAGTDYQASSGTLTFNAGDTSKTFTVSIIDRGDSSKTTRTLNLTLTSAGGGATLGNPASAVLTILENDLTHDEQFVQALYNDFLGRSGAVAELDGWVAALSTLGRTGVANAVARSTEGLSRVVSSFYARFLNRNADAGGLAGWVGALQHGMTEEQVAGALLASPEFANRANALVGGTNADANFVQALYNLLLGRTGSAAEVNSWLSPVAALGRQAAARAFLGSGEFRGDAVRTFYGDPSLTPLPWEPFFINLLHRSQAPTAGEIAGWANSPFDFLTLEVMLAGSQEYYNLH
jgi:Glycoside hydrolase family 44/Calx-beta domain/Domain of unknown function (DUF4214)